MGNDPALTRTVRNLRFAAGVVLLAGSWAACGAPQGNTMSQNARAYIAAFERGEDFKAPSVGLVVQGQPDPAAIHVLANELAVATPEVREKIVALLAELGRSTDPLTPRGADVIRHPYIIEALSGPGLAKADVGREAAMDALRKLVTHPNLARFGASYVQTLEMAASPEAFLLVAKAKPAGAKALVERLAALPRWKQAEAAKVARAALGAADVEEKFLRAAAEAEAASDGKGLARALGTLGLIGTTRSLTAVASRLRTPITILIPRAMEKSVRLSVLEALLYNFPDVPELYPNNIVTEANYAAAEQFCTSALGVTYTTPRPPFLTYRAFPIPVPR